MFKKAIAVALTATMVLSMAVIASADKEVALGTGSPSTDATLLDAMNNDPASVTFTLTYTADVSSENGYENAAIKFHVAGEPDEQVHQCNFANGLEDAQSKTIKGDAALKKLVDGDWGKNSAWVESLIPAGGKIDWVDAAAWNSSEGTLTATATIAGAAATGVVVPVAVVTLLGVSAAGAMVATKKRA